jgi:hypothetical protein
VSEARGADEERERAAALALFTAWLGERFFRTFRAATEAAAPFDALLAQRERRVGVTVGALWDGAAPAAARAFGALVSADLAAAHDDGAYALWLPPGAALPAEEPALSERRVLVARGVAGLAAGERRELRMPATARLAKIDGAGAYVSVVGGLSSVWTDLSEGAPGSFHLDARELHRLPEERAEVELLIARVRDHAALLERGEVTRIELWDSWLVSRLPGPAPAALTVLAAPAEHDPQDGATLRRLLRAHVARALAQRAAGNCDLAALLLVGSIAHMAEERVTAALRGMNPASYTGVDLIALAADGLVRQVLQPRTLPWER